MEDANAPRLIVGLGNPGAEYQNTYHNVGAQALEAIAGSLGDGHDVRWDTYKKIFAYARIPGWIFVRPLSFMNTSGVAVREAAKKFSIPAERIILLHDDSDLPLGTWKISRGRGAAGHHGVESAIAELGTNDFMRVRIGIRPERETVRKKAEEFVLNPITQHSAALLTDAFAAIAEILHTENFI